MKQGSRIAYVGAGIILGFGAAVALGSGWLNESTTEAVEPATSTTIVEVTQDALSTKDITLDQGVMVISAAIAKAEEIGTKMDIAIVDAGGNLKVFGRMDGAWLGSIDIAQKKARTARWFDMNTGTIGELSQPGGPLYGIEHSNDGLITFPGGVPLKLADGTIIGAIGVSGSTVENDHIVAQAGADALLQ